VVKKLNTIQRISLGKLVSIKEPSFNLSSKTKGSIDPLRSSVRGITVVVRTIIFSLVPNTQSCCRFTALLRRSVPEKEVGVIELIPRNTDPEEGETDEEGHSLHVVSCFTSIGSILVSLSKVRNNGKLLLALQEEVRVGTALFSPFSSIISILSWLMGEKKKL
jgi:hypothetical protein